MIAPIDLPTVPELYRTALRNDLAAEVLPALIDLYSSFESHTVGYETPGTTGVDPLCLDDLPNALCRRESWTRQRS